MWVFDGDKRVTLDASAMSGRSQLSCNYQQILEHACARFEQTFTINLKTHIL